MKKLPRQNPAERSKMLLEVANGASKHASLLHAGFILTCAYVMLVTTGTTDLNLLLGKGTILPGVNVDVSLEGFFILAPIAIILAHLYLLLHLQLLSRKLFAFDKSSPAVSLRDQLHLFLNAHYLIGRANGTVYVLLSLAVLVTVILLPLMTLILLQIRFLAYQNEFITWSHRCAIWADLILLFALWPRVVDPNDEWRHFVSQILSYLKCQLWWSASAIFVWISWVLFLFASPNIALGSTILAFAGLLIIFIVSKFGRWSFKKVFRRRENFDDQAVTHEVLPQGGLTLLTVLALGMPLPIAILIEGEYLENFLERRHQYPVRTWKPLREDRISGGQIYGNYSQLNDNEAESFPSIILSSWRKLSLNGGILFTKEAPESKRKLQSDNPRESLDALGNLEAILFT
jgi:hypothetical protein